MEFPRPHMLLCIIVKAKSRRHHGAKDASKDTESGRTWMYSERSAGEAAKVKGQGDQPMLPHQTTLPTCIPPMVSHTLYWFFCVGLTFCRIPCESLLTWGGFCLTSAGKSLPYGKTVPNTFSHTTTL